MTPHLDRLSGEPPPVKIELSIRKEPPGLVQPRRKIAPHLGNLADQHRSERALVIEWQRRCAHLTEVYVKAQGYSLPHRSSN